ncbi:MAG TPA: phosphonopyruvate decarboxylase [Treponemataceae bacterium]|nr:phosphonopyruvate decarboxylase [Treponemataceae bacterium]
MIEPAFFHEQVRKNGTDFFTGVPDSLLKNLCAFITDNEPEEKHIIPANEGSAVGLATGHFLATGKIPLVYMQNSGMGNTINPLLSLVDQDVYRIPMILVIGWRGEPGVKDEPQHITQGRLTCPLLDTIGIPWKIMAEDHDELKKQIDECYNTIKKTGKPFAFVVRKNSFAPYTLKNNPPVKAELSREAAIETVMLASGDRDIFVSTTGMASRELYELRVKHGMHHDHDFLTVGSMGHASQIALGIALEKKDRTIICIDGDGATLMQMGGLAIIGSKRPKNYVHIVLNNGAHDSVGGQPTVALSIDLAQAARACGYAATVSVTTKKELDIELRKEVSGPRFIEVRVSKGAREDLGRPKESPQENKKAFMQFLQN